MEALEALFARFHGEQGFDWFCAGEGQALTDFATYAALAERHGKDWRRWPRGLPPPRRRRVARFRDAQTRARPLPRLDCSG